MTRSPSTIQPIVIDRNVPTALKVAIRKIILNMRADPVAKKVLAGGFIEGFAPIRDQDYDDIRAMLQQAEAANFLSFH
jgi:ABC-type phosphate/phosphonate transport system substrate-binding protein